MVTQQPTSGYVTSYENPDTDGVACSIALAALLSRRFGSTFEPIMFGSINDETDLVLKRYGWQPPRSANGAQLDAQIVLVDTHHPRQLPAGIEPSAVCMIVDHHPGGAPEAFPNAEIQNELVGAAATLVAERWLQQSPDMPSSIAGLLAAAIVSNTLNLAAPTTTDRDLAMYARLSPLCGIDAAFVGEMLAALSARTFDSTRELLRSDYKIFPAARRKIGITQIETARAASAIEREDLAEEILVLRAESDVDYCFMTVVDLAVGWTYTIVPDEATRAVLAAAISLKFDSHGVARSDHIMLRKSDYVPQLIAYLDKVERAQ